MYLHNYDTNYLKKGVIQELALLYTALRPLIALLCFFSTAVCGFFYLKMCSEATKLQLIASFGTF